MRSSLIAFMLISPLLSMEGAKMESLRLSSGKEFRSVAITRISPGEIGITHESGATTIAADELRESLRKEIWPPEPEPPKKDSPYAQATVSFERSASDKMIHEELIKFLAANPKATVLALTIHESGPRVRQHHRIVFDRSKSKLLVMRRTEPHSMAMPQFRTWTCFHVSEKGFKDGIPWIEEDIFKYSKYPAKLSDPLPLHYPDAEDLAEFP